MGEQARWGKRRIRIRIGISRVPLVPSSSDANMGRSAIVRFAPLQNCLVNLPLSITGPLSQRAVVSLVSLGYCRVTGSLTRFASLSLSIKPPQSIAVQLSVAKGSGHARGAQSGQSPTALIAGWTGLSSSIESVSSHLSHARGGASIGDTIEIDPQYAQMSGLGLQEGTLVSLQLILHFRVSLCPPEAFNLFRSTSSS